MKVLFLCLGNICRSPMAEAVFKQMLKDKGLEGKIEVDSAGLGDWHLGEQPHRGTRQVLEAQNIPHDWIRSRQIARRDLDEFDYIVAMDEDNMKGLAEFGASPGPRVFRLLDLVAKRSDKNVPDPYYTGNFEEVFELIHTGCEQLLEHITTSS